MSIDEMAALHRKLDDIHSALVGNPALGHKGLVARVDHIEKEQDGHDRKLIKWGGIITGASLVAGFAKDKFLGGGS